MGSFLKIYLPLTLVLIGAAFFGLRYVDPAPPTTIRLAAGPEDGAYLRHAQSYQKLLANEGIRLEIISTGGSVENLALLEDPASGIDVAFLQGGVGTPEKNQEVVGLASLFLEPVWLFVRDKPNAASATADGSANESDGSAPRQEAPEAETATTTAVEPSITYAKISDLDGHKIAIGAEGSGTRAVALSLLKANGVGDQKTEIWSIGGTDAANALTSGQIDAAFFVTAEKNSAIENLLNDPSVRLLNFERAEAYHRLFPYLASITLPRGVLNLDKDIPHTDITLLAPAATLVARESLHPALSDLLLMAAKRTHEPGGLFEAKGQFPSANYVDFPVSADARRYLERGPTFVRRFLPFWTATTIERWFILAIPLLTLMIPLARIAPPTYRWGTRRRIYRWYSDLRKIEKLAHAATSDADRKMHLNQLSDLQDQIGRIKVPLAYMDNLFHLRQHVDFVQHRIANNEINGMVPSVGKKFNGGAKDDAPLLLDKLHTDDAVTTDEMSHLGAPGPRPGDEETGVSSKAVLKDYLDDQADDQHERPVA